MNLARFSIESNRISITIMVTVLLLGAVLYQSLARDSMPPYTIRVASIVTSFPGASPERVEELVTDKLEKVAQELPELKEVSSTSRTGLSVVQVTLKDEVGPGDLQPVWDRLRRKMDTLSGLPQGVHPQLKDDDVGVVYAIAIGMTGDGYDYAELKEFADDLRDELIRLPSAAKVEIGGAQDERVFIEFDDGRLKEYGLTANRLQNILSSTNILSSGGEINLGNERTILEPTGSFADIRDLERTLIPVGDNGDVVYLSDIAKVSMSYVDPPSQLVQVTGQRALSIHVNLKSGENIITLGQGVDRVLAEWAEKAPIGIELTRISSLDSYIDEKISDFMSNLVQAIAIVLAVMLIFLGFRTGFVIASLIPMVTVMTLMLMGLFKVGLNQVSLAALIMALGMMVDNAIVVAESIMVKMSRGDDPKDAAISSCTELSTPLLISTLTTSAAFLAFFLAESVMGDIVGPIFVVISFALLSSWLIALSIVSMMCYVFLKRPGADEKVSLVDRAIARLKVSYKGLILQALARKWIFTVGILVLFVVSLQGFRFIPFVFFPDSDRNTITVDINLPQGTRLERTEQIVLEIERFMSDSLTVNDQRDQGVTSWSSFVGEGPASYDMGYAADEADPSYAHILVNTSGFFANAALIERLDRWSFEEFPGADIKVGPLGAGGSGTPVEVKVSGDDPDQLAAIAESIKTRLSSLSGTKNVKDDWGPKIKKLVVAIDQVRAQSAGVSSQDIATSLQTVLSGFRAGEFRENDKSIPIVLRGDESQQQTLESLETLQVFAQSSGASVPLLQVARIIPEWQYARIKRLNLKRTINVSSELTSTGNASAVTAELQPWLDEQRASWPTGYDYEFYGDARSTAENMGAVVKYLPLSAFIILLLLIIQFNSMRKTAIVTLTIPLGIIGVVAGLLLFRESFGFMPFLGVISLAGIVINNAIVLLDRMKIENEEIGRPIQDAIIVACLQRFRPILLATTTTILGLVPLYLSGGEIWEGMAVSIMVGLLFGTVITLLFVPALYSILYRVSYSNYKFDPKLLNE